MVKGPGGKTSVEKPGGKTGGGNTGGKDRGEGKVEGHEGVLDECLVRVQWRDLLVGMNSSISNYKSTEEHIFHKDNRLSDRTHIWKQKKCFLLIFFKSADTYLRFFLH